MLDALFDEIEQAADAYARKPGRLRELVLHRLKADHGIGNRGIKYSLRFHFGWASPRERAVLLEVLSDALENIDSISSGRPEAVLARKALVTPFALQDRLNRILERDGIALRLERGKWAGEVSASAATTATAKTSVLKAQPNVTRSVEELLRALYKWERERDEREPEGHFSSESVADELGWTPTTLNRAVEVLEKRSLVDVDESLGSTPFVTHGFSLSEEGFLECERLGLDRSDPMSEDAGMAAQQATSAPDPKKVFIIHGRNTAARVAVEQFLKALKLEPLDFDELAADMGTEFVGNIVVEGLRRARGIVSLFTPDEFAALLPAFRSEHDQEGDIKRWQSRPNVIFEAGITFGLARERSVLATVGPDVSLFSDVAGIHLLRLNNSTASRGKFRQKLIGMGCAVDERSDAWTDPSRSGDFETCLGPLKGVSARDPFPEADARSGGL